MKDYLGNRVSVGDTVIMAIKSGKQAMLARGYVKATEHKAPYPGWLATDMLLIEWSNIHTYWIPASKVVAIPDDMLPEKRREKFNAAVEAVQP